MSARAASARREHYVELAFAGRLRPETVGMFIDRVGDYCKRFGLTLESGAAHGEEYPGTSALLDRAVAVLAEQRGVPVKQVYGELADEVRGAAVA